MSTRLHTAIVAVVIALAVVMAALTCQSDLACQQRGGILIETAASYACVDLSTGELR